MTNPKISFQDKLGFYLNASYPLLWVQTHEELRLFTDISEAFLNPPQELNRRARTIFEWDIVRGLTKCEENKLRTKIAGGENIKKILEYIETSSGDHQLFILKDFHPYFQEPQVRRSIRNLVGRLKSKSTTILFVSPVCAIPEELIKEVQLMEYALPDETALRSRLAFVQRAADLTKPANSTNDFSITPEIQLKAVEAAKGLTDGEAENAFTLALVENKSFSEKFVQTVFGEKVIQVKKNGLLTYMEPDVTFDQVGGLNGLKAWIKQRGKAYLPEARVYGLPYPRGILLAGIPGTGKSLIAKAASAELGLPLFQLDVGNLFASLVGATEQNFRRVLQIIDGIGSCILFID